MRSGTGIDPRPALAAALLVAVLSGVSVPDGAAADQSQPPGDPETTTSLEPHQPDGAARAQAVNVFTISGSPAPTRIHAFTSADTGRLTLTSPEGIAAPSSPPGACTQDNPTQVSCAPGTVAAIVGDMLAGADTITTDPALTVAIGIRKAGPDSPLIGGGGRDRILGAAADDLIEGGPGGDSVQGNAGTDILRGGSGGDTINGGASPDALYGGSGADKLNGAPGRDLCVGGSGRDRDRSCLVSKTIP